MQSNIFKVYIKTGKVNIINQTAGIWIMNDAISGNYDGYAMICTLLSRCFRYGGNLGNFTNLLSFMT